MKHLTFLLPVIILLSGCMKTNHRLFTGAFTDTGEQGLSVYDYKNGRLSLVSRADAGPNPSYFCYSPSLKLLYVINESEKFEGGDGGGITTMKYDPAKGSLEKISSMLIPNGGPCFVSLSPGGAFLFVANYPEGSVVVVRLDDKGIPVETTDYILYEKDTTKVSHAHMILNDPSGKRIVVTDLGLDRILIYGFDHSSGKLVPSDTIKVPQGYGPRHFDFSRDGSRMYVINELGSTMMVFDMTRNNEPIQTIQTCREDFKGQNYCADIHISPDGRFLYGSNRGENTIVTFRIGDDGMLALQGHTSCGGDWPRNFTLDPSGKFLLAGNQKSGNIAVFRLDEQTGLPAGDPELYENMAPACLKFYN